MPSFLKFLSEKLSTDTKRLTATYVVIIMSLTIIFSSVIYVISASQLAKPLSLYGTNQWQDYQFGQGGRYFSMQDVIDQRAAEARGELVAWLVALNLVVLFISLFLSYFLARKTLAPIEAAIEAQARFVSDASHELRTPLTALQTTNEVALRKKKLTLTEAKELIGYNLTETIKLGKISDALLGLAKQNESSVSREQFDIKHVISSAIESFTPLAEDKSITIKYNVSSIFVLANQPALEQVMRILIENAIKYSPPNSTITISAKNDAADAVISVKDEGPGIAPNHQAKIFERFYRVDESRSSQNIEGAGLGLSIAKAISLRNGFGLSVSSAPNNGAEFSIRVPR